MNIPESAVLSAAKAAAEADLTVWDALSERDQAWWRYIMRQALEAAAPHLLGIEGGA